MGTINLDPPEEFLEAENLNALIDLWLATLDVDPATYASYNSRIAHFCRWWQAVGPAEEWRLTKALLKDFEKHLRGFTTRRFGKPMSYHTRHGVIRTLRTMFRWAVDNGRTEKNYGVWIPWPTGEPPKRRSARPEHLARLMLAAAESRQSLRDQALLSFFIGTGCRRGEVAGLSVEDLTILADGSGTALVTGKSTDANPSGQRAVAFHASTGKWLIRYMDEMAITAGPLWLNDWGNQFQAAGIYRMVKNTIDRAGLANHIQGCHDLRRAFATILVKMHPDSPGWHDLIRRQLGHKHFKMTTIYTLLDADDIRDQIVTPLDLT